MQRSSLAVVVMALVIAWSVVPVPVSAQATEYIKYVSDDLSFGFYYPADWVQEYDDYYGTVDLYFEDGGIFIYTPDVLADWQMADQDAVTFLRLLAPDWDLMSSDVIPLLDNAYMLMEQIDDEGDPYTNMIFAGPLDDGTLVVLDVFVYNDMFEEYFDDVLLIFHSMDLASGGAHPTEVNDDMLSTVDDTLTAFLDEAPTAAAIGLSDYGSGWQAAIIELQEAQLIPASGSLLFSEDYAYFTGQGSFYTPLARNAPRTNFVMTAKLSFTPSGSSEIETCTLGMRVNWEGNTTTSYLDVGYTSEDGVFYMDLPATGEQVVGLSDVSVTSGTKHTFTIIALDDQLTVYVDGVLALDGVTVEARAGSWGVGLLGQGVNALCEASDIWVYSLD